MTSIPIRPLTRLHDHLESQEWPSDDEGEEEEALLWVGGGCIRAFLVLWVGARWELSLKVVLVDADADADEDEEDGGGSSSLTVMPSAGARIALLEKEAARLHEVAKGHNLRGDFESAKAAYRQMYSVEDEALLLVAAEGEKGAVGAGPSAAVAAEYAALLPLPSSPWPDRATQRRALGAVLGAVVADAAAMGVHWVYSPLELDRLFALRESTPADTQDAEVGLEFFEPPQSPFFSYLSGRASPYGEQSLELLASLVEQRGLHPLRYAKALARRFGQGWDGYRDASLKGFLRHFYRGRRPPQSGAQDWQANCFTRLAPLVAAYHGSSGQEQGQLQPPDGLPLLLSAVDRATRVTQNADRAVAWARTGAAVMARVIGGGSIDDAVAAVLVDLVDSRTALGGDAQLAELNAEIAAHLEQAQQMARAGQSVHAVVAALGRNCHLPNSLQTPLHAALLYSLRSSAPSTPTTAGERQRVYKAAVRAALREGGCAASRATYTGAILGAWLAGAGAGAGADGGTDMEGADPDFLPSGWTAQVTGFETTRRQAEVLVGFRKCTLKDGP